MKRKHIEIIIKSFSGNQDIKKYLECEISSGRLRVQLIKLAALMHDIGKPKTLRIERGRVRFHGHEHVGAFMFGEFARRMKLSNTEFDSSNLLKVTALPP